MQTDKHIAELRHCLTVYGNMGHHAVLLQAEVDSWPSSHAATPGAVLLAVAGPGLPGAPSRQGSGMAEELDAICSYVSLEVEGTTRQVRCPTSSGASKHDAASSPHSACLCNHTAGRGAVPGCAMLSGV